MLLRFLGFGLPAGDEQRGLARDAEVRHSDPIAFAPRQKQLSDFVETKKCWTLPKSCGSRSSGWGGAQEEHGQERARCVHVMDLGKTVTCHGPSRGGTRVSSGLNARQMEELEEERKKSRAGTGSLCILAGQSH